MAKQSLATKYRPTIFESMLGQDSVLKILSRQIAEDKFKNAYLFSGTSGCGKTTAARAFATAINKGAGVPIEIDAASNNGVENVRSIIKAAQERSIESNYKIYIIDEAHALTSQSWQAFLKCLEEPPKYTIFIFCTTDPQKIPPTILNRVQRFNFTRVSADKIQSRLNFICKEEGFTNFEDSTEYISKICEGSVRNAISMLEKCADYSENLSLDNVTKALGNYSYKVFFRLMNAMLDGDEKTILSNINDLYNDGADLKIFIDQYLDFVLDLAKYEVFRSIYITKFPKNYEDQARSCVEFQNSGKYYNYVTDKLLELKNAARTDMNVKATLEVYFLQITRCV